MVVLDTIVSYVQLDNKCMRKLVTIKYDFIIASAIPSTFKVMIRGSFIRKPLSRLGATRARIGIRSLGLEGGSCMWLVSIQSRFEISSKNIRYNTQTVCISHVVLAKFNKKNNTKSRLAYNLII